MIFYSLCSRSLSKFTRAFTTLRLPRFLRSRLFKTFSSIFGVNLDEVEKQLQEYTSFDSFFTRDLKKGCRPIIASKEVLVSPVDGIVLESGHIKHGTLIQAKGLPYSVSDLCPAFDTSLFKNGSFTTIYLSPKDCHNIYAPYNGTLSKITHVPGKLYPVREPYISSFKNLYTKNERLNLYVDTEYGKMAIILVGAFNVGTMTTPLDKSFETNSHSLSITHKNYSDVQIKKGEKIGTFHLGSTVILITENKTTIVKETKSLVKIGSELVKTI
jgi:phosphatidylserine decarboxylase